MGIDEEKDTVMGEAETAAGSGSPTQPAMDEAEVISDDQDAAAEFSARSGRDQILDASAISTTYLLMTLATTRRPN